MLSKCTSQNCRSYIEHLIVQIKPLEQWHSETDTTNKRLKIKGGQANPDSSQAVKETWAAVHRTKRMTPLVNSSWWVIIFYTSLVPLSGGNEWPQNIWQMLIHFISEYLLLLAKHLCSLNKGQLSGSAGGPSFQLTLTHSPYYAPLVEKVHGEILLKVSESLIYYIHKTG